MAARPGLPQLMNGINPHDLAQEWIHAWNSHDLELILKHYHQDIEFSSPFIARLTHRADGTVRGRKELGEYFARGLAAYPDLHFKLVRVFSGVRRCVLEYQSVNGLQAAEFMELDEDGLVRRVSAHYSEAL